MIGYYCSQFSQKNRDVINYNLTDIVRHEFMYIFRYSSHTTSPPPVVLPSLPPPYSSHPHPSLTPSLPLPPSPPSPSAIHLPILSVMSSCIFSAVLSLGFIHRIGRRHNSRQSFLSEKPKPKCFETTFREGGNK